MQWKPSRSPRTLLASFVLVGLAFITATVCAQLAAVGIDAEVETVSGNALPSIEQLSVARTALRHLEVSSDVYAEGEEGLRSQTHEQLLHARRDLDAALMTYLTFPAFEGERAMFDQLLPHLRSLDVALDKIERAIAAGDGAMARAVVDNDARAAIDELDGVISRLITLNARGAHAASAKIGLLRGRSNKVAIALDALCGLLAVAAGVIVTRAVRRYASLQEEHAKLVERRANELEVFSQRVAHDLVGPMSALSFVLGGAKRKAPHDPQLIEAFDRANACIQRSRRLIEAIFEFARSGAQPNLNARTDVRPVLDGVAEEARAADPRVVRIDIEPFAPCAVACATGVLTSIASNLIHNAVKHTPDGAEPCVAITVAATRDRVRIAVRDFGVGLAPGLDPAAVFDPYVRSGSTRPGLGLGLATVKRFTESHGGAVGVDSTPGRGCTFWVELPRASESSERASVVEIGVRNAVGS